MFERGPNLIGNLSFPELVILGCWFVATLGFIRDRRLGIRSPIFLIVIIIGLFSLVALSAFDLLIGLPRYD